MAGYVSPEKEWPYITQAWQERVLDGPPRLPFLHMNQIRRESWRYAHCISYNDAEERVSEAVRILFSSGITSAIGSHMRRDHLKIAMQETLSAVNIKRIPFSLRDPDYLCFIAYAMFVLFQVHRRCPDAQRVNFYVSRKKKISQHIGDFHETLKAQLDPPLDALAGDLYPADMERVLPLQAADVLCWHMQRYFAKTMEPIDEYRLWRLGETKGILHENTLAGCGKSS
jgi:hypothetical protein